MREQQKLSEAEHFLNRMQAEIEAPVIFKFELSAFLSAARSVLQYALAEAEGRPGGKAWYDAYMRSDAVLTFFKDKRNINVHTQPVEVDGTFHIAIEDKLNLSDSLTISMIDKDGNVVEQETGYSSEPKKAAKQPVSNVTIMHSYSFPDWPGSDDVMSLCTRYLNSLRAAVQDGVKGGFLST